MKRLAQSLLATLGYRIVRAGSAPQAAYGLDCFFPVLKGLGFAPRHILDVGANHGNWTRAALRYFPEAQYTLVEPQDELKRYVADLVAAGYKIRWVNAGAGDVAGTMAFTVSHRDDSSTFALSAEEARAAGLRQIMVEVKTLNEIARVAGAVPEMVKIDAEGLDLQVLAGASELLGKTEVFLVEAALCAGYENTVDRVVGCMHESGYKLADITDLNRSPKHGVLWLCELAFLREGSRLLDGVTSYE